MQFVVIYALTHSEEHPHHHVAEVLEKEFGLKRFELQKDRKVLTPHGTVIGENSKYKSSDALIHAIQDRLYDEEIVFDRLFACTTDDHTLIG